MNYTFDQFLSDAVKYVIPFVSLGLSAYAIRRTIPKTGLLLRVERINATVLRIKLIYINRSPSPTSIVEEALSVSGNKEIRFSPYSYATLTDGSVVNIEKLKLPFRIDTYGSVVSEYLIFIDETYTGEKISVSVITSVKTLRDTAVIPKLG